MNKYTIVYIFHSFILGPFLGNISIQGLQLIWNVNNKTKKDTDETANNDYFYLSIQFKILFVMSIIMIIYHSIKSYKMLIGKYK